MEGWDPEGERPPDWRWQVARQRVEKPRAPLFPHADLVVRMIVRFWSARCAARNAEEIRRAEAMMPVMAAAYRIYACSEPIRRHLLEARLLAGESPKEIGHKGVAVARVAACYADVFFDVAPRLHRPDFIVASVLGPPNASVDYAAVWKLMGYVGGPKVLDRIVAATSLVPRPENSGQVDAFLAAQGRAAVQQQMTLAALLSDVGDDRLRHRLVDVQAALVVEQAREGIGPTGNSVLDFVKQMLDELPFTIGPQAVAVRPHDHSAPQPYDVGAAEWRDADILRENFGQEVPERERLSALPPPRRKGGDVPGQGPTLVPPSSER